MVCFVYLLHDRSQSQAVETQQISSHKAAYKALNTSLFAQKINANISQIFEKTTLCGTFFHVFY